MTFITDLVSSYVHEAHISAIKQMAMLRSKVEGAASLTWGLPSFRTPDYIREAVKNCLDKDLDAGKYSLPDGLSELRDLVVEKHLADTGIEVSAADNVMICAGNY
jgi:aminotransferase